MGGRGIRSRYENTLEDYLAANDLDKVDELLSKVSKLPGKDVNTLLEDGLAPLHIAAKRGQIKMMALLLRRGADINLKDSKGCTPLMIAVTEDVPESIGYLAEKGADVTRADKDGVIPLSRAAEAGNSNIVALLLEAGAALDGRDANGRTPLMAAAEKGRSLMVGTLAVCGASCTLTDDKGNTAMHYAARSVENDMTLRVLAGKADIINKRNNEGETPLIIAIEKHNMDNAQTLMDLGADPEIADNAGVNAMGHATALRRVKFRQAMSGILQNEGEAVRRTARKGTAQEVKPMKPLVLKKVQRP